MKLLILLSLLCVTLTSNVWGQKTDSKDKVNIDKWVHAVVNLQCSTINSDQTTLLNHQFLNRQITEATFRRKTDSLIYSSLSTGTAIYLFFNHRHYLLTARHVLNGPIKLDYLGKVDSSAIHNTIILIDDINHQVQTTVIDQNDNMVTNNDEVFLMGYQNYVFSSLGDDIGIICLEGPDEQGTEFWKALDSRGYIPITIDDIDDRCNIKPGQKLIALGYPQDFSVVGNKRLPAAAFVWQSAQITYPIITNGEVAQNVANRNYFYGDIFVYHGNSGGPAITNNKLVGIVHGPAIQALPSGKLYYGLYYSQFMKSSLIMPLLKRIDNINNWSDKRNKINK